VVGFCSCSEEVFLGVQLSHGRPEKQHSGTMGSFFAKEPRVRELDTIHGGWPNDVVAPSGWIVLGIIRAMMIRREDIGPPRINASRRKSRR